jgi:cytochrome c peroxidase
MKKLIILLLLVMAVACRSRSGQENEASTSTEDTALMNLARTYFTSIPAEAASADNPVSDAKVQLGQVLFYDTRLSKSGNNSCNSCHNLSTYGVDNVPTSIGDAGQPGDRNSPTVFNAALHNMQFWDGRAATVEEQAGMPILNPDEMAIPHKGFLVGRLRKDTMYRRLFGSAFPGDPDPLTYANLRRAIGAFERTLLTPSRFDRYMAGDMAALSMEEKKGLRLFIDAGCAECHRGVAVGGESLQKFGFYTDYRTLTRSRLDDSGRMAVTGDRKDKDVFKVPGLRNVEMTYPYFHDGSIASLDSTIAIMAKSQMDRTFSEAEIRDIVAFLHTMTGDIRSEAKVFPKVLEGVKK